MVSEIHLNQEITLPVFLHRLHVSRLTNHSRMDVSHDLTLHGQALLKATSPPSSVCQDHSFWKGSFYLPWAGPSLTPVHHPQDCSQPLGFRGFLAWLHSGGPWRPTPLGPQTGHKGRSHRDVQRLLLKETRGFPGVATGWDVAGAVLLPSLGQLSRSHLPERQVSHKCLQ